MEPKGFVTLPSQQLILNNTPGRTCTIKVQTEQSGESVMVFEEVAPPGTATTLHLHHNSDEVACILSGEFSFKIGDHVSTGGTGTSAFMPRGIPQAWKNIGTEPGRAIFIYTPAQAGKLFEALARLQRPFSPNDPEIAQLFKRHGWEILGPSPL